MTAPITITAAQRNLLYDRILGCLCRLGDLWMVIEREEFELAARLGLEISDDLRLLVNDLGWGEGSGESVVLASPPDVLRRALVRHCGDAVVQGVEEERERAVAGQETREAKEGNDEVISTCRRVLAELDLAEVRYGSAEL